MQCNVFICSTYFCLIQVILFVAVEPIPGTRNIGIAMVCNNIREKSTCLTFVFGKLQDLDFKLPNHLHFLYHFITTGGFDQWGEFQ